jgi:hypothetical protein
MNMTNAAKNASVDIKILTAREAEEDGVDGSEVGEVG